MNIGFDCDGVLSNFTRGFSGIGNKLFNLPIVEEEEVKHWNWYKWYCTKEQESNMWEEVKRTDFFWRNLNAFNILEVKNIISLASLRNNVYVITSRIDTGQPVKIPALYQTRTWFSDYIGVSPSVLVSSAKGLLCNGLRMDFYIDDKFTNCVDVVKSSPRTRVFMLEKKHNRLIIDMFPSYFEKRTRNFPEITIVSSISQYYDEILKNRR